MNSELRTIYDGATSFTPNGPETFVGPGIDPLSTDVGLDRLNNVRGADRGQLGAQTYAVTIMVSSIVTSAAEEYQLYAQSENGVNFAQTAVTGDGVYTVLLDAKTMNELDPTATVLRLEMERSAATASVELLAWLNPIIPLTDIME